MTSQQQRLQQQRLQQRQKQRTATAPRPVDATRRVPNSLNSMFTKLSSWTKLDSRSRLRILDVILNCALLTPLAVLFQVSASGVQDALFLNRVSGHVGTALLLAIAFVIEFGCSFWQKYLASIRYVSERLPHDPSYVVTTRFYHFAIGFANVCHYRGLSDIYYYLLGYGSYAAIQATVSTIVVLSTLKCIRNILGPPLSVGVDVTIENFFEAGTLFRTRDDAHYRYFADHVSTVTVVTSLCFLHWIAVWAFFDCVIFPENTAVSVILSWLFGYIIVVMALLVEPLAVRFSRQLDARGGRSMKLLLEDAFLVLANSGVILVWRAHWIFFESLMYYFPIYSGQLDLTAFYGLAGSFLMMVMLHASATLILKGCDFDGELPEGRGVSFGIDYFGEFFKDHIARQEGAMMDGDAYKTEDLQRFSDLDQGWSNIRHKKTTS